MLAEALYDNDSEWQDELAFKKGDLLHVIDTNPAQGSAEGWWVCLDVQGRRGIAPANRLQVLAKNLSSEKVNLCFFGFHCVLFTFVNCY